MCFIRLRVFFTFLWFGRKTRHFTSCFFIPPPRRLLHDDDESNDDYSDDLDDYDFV